MSRATDAGAPPRPALTALAEGRLEDSWAACVEALARGDADDHDHGLARAVAAVMMVASERTEQPPPSFPDTLDDPRPEDAERLVGPAEHLLQAERWEEGAVVAEVIDMLDPAHPKAASLRRWATERRPPPELAPAPIIEDREPDDVAHDDAPGDAHDDAPGDAHDATEAEPPEGLPPVHGAAWRRTRAAWWRTTRRLLVLSVLGALLFGALWTVPYPLKVTEPFELLPSVRRQVRARVPGIIDEVTIAEGDDVEAGAVLATLDVRELETERATTQAERERLEAELAKLRRGTRKEQIDRARHEASRLAAAHDHARKKLRRVESLHTQGLVPDEELDDARADVEIARREWAAARAELRLLEAGSREEDIEAKQAQLQTTHERLALIDRQLADSVIRAPLAGRVTTPHLEERLGQHLEVGDLLTELAVFDVMRAELLVSPKELDAIEEGMPVVLKASAFPTRDYHGVVEQIAPVATPSPLDQRRVVRVTVFVDNDDGQLRGGTTGWAEIIGPPRSLLWLGTRRALRWVRTRWVI